MLLDLVFFSLNYFEGAKDYKISLNPCQERITPITVLTEGLRATQSATSLLGITFSFTAKLVPIPCHYIGLCSLHKTTNWNVHRASVFFCFILNTFNNFVRFSSKRYLSRLGAGDVHNKDAIKTGQLQGARCYLRSKQAQRFPDIRRT